MKHLLTHEELLEIKALKERRKVSTADVPMLNVIYGRMIAGYNLCATCIETLAAEAKSLISYAEKQIGSPILDYTEEHEQWQQSEDFEEVADTVTGKVTATKNVVVVREHEGRLANVTITVPTEIDGVAIPDDHSVEGEFPIVNVEYIDSVKLDIPLDAAAELIVSILENTPSDVIVKHVFDTTGVELSADAERSELIESAIDILAEHAAQQPPATAAKIVEKGAKIELHKNGLTATKGELIYAYVKQEKGIELQKGLKRPALLAAATEALKDAK